MKTILSLTIFLLIISSAGFAQDQFVSREISYDLYEDTKYEVFYQSSGFYEYVAEIKWDYENKKVVIYDKQQQSYLVAATWKTEVNPDDITGDENNRFIFDPTKNDLGMKVLKIYVEDDGTFTYKLECGKQIIKIIGIDWDADGDGIADGSFEESEGESDETGTIYLNLENTTDHTIYVLTNIQDASGKWVHSTTWLVIEPGQSEMIGTTFNDHFYYYAYCVDAKGEYIIWEGTDQYHQLEGKEGSYGFRHVGMSDGAFDDSGEVWFMQLTL